MTDWRKVLRQVAPHADPHILAGVLATIDPVFPKYRINTVARQADFLAHCVVESQGLTRIEENLNYSAGRLVQVWPKRFPTVMAAQPYAHNPRALANKVYGGRMGNRAGTDDGWNNRGSGILQCTGADNMEGGAEAFGISVAEYAERLRDPDHAFECAVELYVRLGAMRYADKGDIAGSTRCVNGGENGLSERRRFRDQLRVIIPKATSAATAAVGFVAMPDVAADGDPKVRAAQDRLKALGYFPGKTDGDFGPNMRGELVKFQGDNGLEASGDLDEETLAALGSAMTPARALPASRTEATVDDLRAQGSETIKAADDAEKGLSTKVAAGAVTIGTLTETVSQANSAKDAVSTLPDLLQFVVSHALLISVVIVAGVIWYERKAIRAALDRVREARLKDKRSGANMGR